MARTISRSVPTAAAIAWAVPHVRRAVFGYATGSAVGKILSLSRETFDEAAPIVYEAFEHTRLAMLRAVTVDYDRYRFYLSLIHTVKHTSSSPAETFEIFATYPRLNVLYDDLPGSIGWFAVLYWGSNVDGSVCVEVVVDGIGETEDSGVRGKVEAVIPGTWTVLPARQSEGEGEVRRSSSLGGLKKRDTPTPPCRRREGRDVGRWGRGEE